MNPISGYAAGNSAKSSGSERTAADSFTQAFTKAAKSSYYTSDKAVFQPAERKTESPKRKTKVQDDAGDNADQLNANQQINDAKDNTDASQTKSDELARDIKEGAQELRQAAKDAASEEAQKTAALKNQQAEFVNTAMSEIEKLMKTFGIKQGTSITEATFEKLAAEEIIDYQAVEMQYGMKPGTNPTDQLANLSADQQSYLEALRNGLLENTAGETAFDRLDSGELALPEWMKSIYKKPEKLNNAANVFAPVINAQPDAAAVTQVVVDTTGASPSEVLTKIVESIKTGVDSNKQTMEIAFKPSVLGGLEIKMSMTSEGFSAQIFATTKYAQSVINGQIAQLTEALKERGITVNQIEVLEQNPDAALNFSQQSFFGFQQEQRGQYKPEGQSAAPPNINLDSSLDEVSSALENAYTQLEDTTAEASSSMDVIA